jgi:ribonuclease J
VIITTGSQGEPMAALSRMAMAEHHHISIAPGDTVIISASPIPGNEKSVGRIINQLFKEGANVVYEPHLGVIPRATPSRRNSNCSSTCASLSTSCPFTANTACF